MNTTQIIRPKQAASLCGFSTTTLWRLENQDPDFPKKIRFTSRCVGFRLADIERWLADKAEG